MSEEDQLTCQQAADDLGVSQSRVYALVRQGRLKATKFGERAYTIRRGDLAAVRIRNNKRGPKKTTL